MFEHPTGTPRERGFTLIELMLVVAIIGTLAYLAAPNLQRMVRRSDVRSEARILYGAYLEAQGLALSSGRRSELELIRIGDERGWVIRADRDGDGTREVASRHRLVESRPSIAFGPGSGFPTAFPAPFSAVAHDSWCTVCGTDSGTIVFDPDGTVPGAPAGGSIVLEDAGGTVDEVEAIVFVGATGAVRLERKD